MRSVNKIRERDLDPNFLLSLMSNVQQINVTELLNGYLRKDEVLPRTSLPEDYVKAIDDAIEELQQNTVDIKDQYRLISKPITTDDLDSELHDILTAMFYFLQHIKAQDNNLPLITYSDNGERIIIIKDAEGNEHNVVIPIMYDTEGESLNAIDKARLETQISTLQNQITSLTSTVQTLQRRVDNLKAGGSSGFNFDNLDLDNIDNETIAQLLEILTNQASRIKTLEETLSTLQSGNSSNSLSSIATRVQQCEEDITTLNAKTAQRVQYSNLNTELQQKIDDVVDIKRRVALVETNKMSVPSLNSSGYLYYSSEAGNVVKSREPMIKAAVCKSSEEIVIAQNNNERFIINLQTGEGYQYNDLTRAYDLVQVERNPEYNYMLVLNTLTELIEYLILEGTMVKLNVNSNSSELINSANLTVRKANIAANASCRIRRLNNLQKLPPVILIYDFEDNSRTTGTYINNEGVITVSHDTEGFTLHNDSSFGLEVLIMAGD